MKIGVSTFVWVSPLITNDLMTLVPLVTEMGFDAIEIGIENEGDIDYDVAGRLIRDHNLGASVATALSPGRELLERDMQRIQHSIDAAHTIGSNYLVGAFFCGRGQKWVSTPEERERDMELLVPQLRELANYAADRGVIMCVEAVNRFETSFLNTAAQSIELVDRVGHPSFQMNLDTFHLNIEEKSIGDAIRAAGPRLRNLHVSENDRGTPGQGHIPWSEVADALRDIDYDDFLVIESFTPRIERIATAAAIWRPLAESQDALAREGLAFLRQLLA